MQSTAHTLIAGRRNCQCSERALAGAVAMAVQGVLGEGAERLDRLDAGERFRRPRLVGNNKRFLILP